MRKSLLATLFVIVLCSLCLTGTVSATKAGFTMTDGTGTLVTVDGIVGAGEWDDSWSGKLYDGWTLTNNTYRVKWVGVGSTWYDQWLLEIFSDTTNDTGDFIQICYDSNLDGGSAPQTDDYLINYTAHSKIAEFKGTGSGWAPTSDLDVIVASTISASPSSATPHWIIEINIENVWEDTGDRIAAYDASTGTTLMWPPYSNPNVPDDYGYSQLSYTALPEGLTIGVMILTSSVAVVASIRYFRKRPKIKSSGQVKL
jgi:hypothetical protein